jgi:hypothetical protein
MDNKPIYQNANPTSAYLELPKSSNPILTPSYELRPCLIKLIQKQSFLKDGNENPYSHLCEFE